MFVLYYINKVESRGSQMILVPRKKKIIATCKAVARTEITIYTIAKVAQKLQRLIFSI